MRHFLTSACTAAALVLIAASAHAQNHWTVDQVLTTDPFNTIDIDTAGTSVQTVKNFADKLNADQRAELMGRCGVINNPDYAPRYSDEARIFCQHYLMAEGHGPGGQSALNTR